LEQFRNYYYGAESTHAVAIAVGTGHALSLQTGNALSPQTENETEITKTDIFHYVYAVLHNPAYRKKYELNLKREFAPLVCELLK